MNVELNKIIGAIENEIEAFGTVIDVTNFRELQKRLERYLITDPLTGVLNRWKFEDVLNREIQSAKKLKKPLCLMMIDIDNFKRINDCYGHIDGDEILKSLVRQMEKVVEGSVGKSHHLGRWGGDEFLYIIPLKDMEESQKIAEKMKKNISEMMNLNVSIGIAQLKNQSSVTSLIKSADKAMYVDKNGKK